MEIKLLQNFRTLLHFSYQTYSLKFSVLSNKGEKIIYFYMISSVIDTPEQKPYRTTLF